MGLSFFSKSKNTVVARCQEDYATTMRKRYAPYYHAMDAQTGTHIHLDGKDMIMLSSNDYLGLSFHPKVIEASCAAIHRWGTSTNGARPSNGSRSFHLELENKLAAFLGKEACHVHAAGYLSCMSAVASFAQKGDLIFADKNIHSCLLDGAKASLATVERFSHNRPDDFQEMVSTAASDAPKFLIAEGVYSMEGHIGRLPELIKISDNYKCFNIIDDAHGFGVFGKQGRGTVDHFGLTDKIDIICGSLSKSLASTGGFVAGSSDVIEYMRTNSKQTIFSAALSPGQAAAAQRYRTRKGRRPLDARRRGVCRSGPRCRIARSFRAQRLPHRRHDPFRRQQSDRLHHQPSLRALRSLLHRSRQGSSGADLPRQRR